MYWFAFGATSSLRFSALLVAPPPTRSQRARAPPCASAQDAVRNGCIPDAGGEAPEGEGRMSPVWREVPRLGQFDPWTEEEDV